MALLKSIFFPIIWILTLFLDVYFSLFGSYGLAIVLLSVSVKIVTWPITKAAERLEAGDVRLQLEMAPKIAAAKASYKGQERFEAIDAIYQEHGYHPIKSMTSLLPLFFQLPFLISALILLTDYPPIAGQSYLFIEDLARQDGLLPLGSTISINLLPLIMTAVALIDSMSRPASNRSAKMRFLAISIVLLVLVYPLPAAVCLYWLISNCCALSLTIFSRFDRLAEA